MRTVEIPSSSRTGDSLQPVDIQTIFFQSNVMYQHNIIQVNYTTYDVRRAQDTVNPKTDHRDIMLLSGNEYGRRNSATHPYQYARVLGIYHVNLIYNEPTTHQYQIRRMEFLWIRHFELIQNVPVGRGWSSGRLDQLRFRRIEQADAFGFVDPARVLRGCHLIPNFFLGKCRSDAATAVSSCAQNVHDWVGYYANR